MANIFDEDLPRTEANYAPLSPLSFIARTAEVYPHRLAVVHGDLRRNWLEVFTRCRQLASALEKAGIGKGNRRSRCTTSSKNRFFDYLNKINPY